MGALTTPISDSGGKVRGVYGRKGMNPVKTAVNAAAYPGRTGSLGNKATRTLGKLKEAQEWLQEARDTRGHDKEQAAFAAQQARRAIRQARGASTKIGSGRSLQARRARAFSARMGSGEAER